MLKKISQKYKNMPIKNKIIVAVVPLLIMQMLLVLTISSHLSSKRIMEKTNQSAQDQGGLIVNRFENIHNNIITLSNILTKDINSIYEGINPEELSEISFISLKNQIYAALDYNRRSFPEISSIIFMDNNYNTTTNGLLSELDVFKVRKNLIDHIESTGLPYPKFFNVNTREYMAENEPVLTIGKRIINFNTGENIGYILINVRESTMLSAFPGKEGTENAMEDYLILDKSGTLLLTRNKLDSSEIVKAINLHENLLENYKQSYELKVNHVPYLFSVQKINKFNWYLVNQISVNKLKKEIYINSSITILIGSISTIITVCMLIFMSKLITSPIQKLTRAVKDVWKGNFKVKIEVESADEIGILSRGFNKMVENMDELLHRIEADQKKRREHELALIQLQIKPHFLYNTLELIYVLCELNEPYKAAETTKALADFYRTSLSNGDEIISIKDEIKNIENYLHIQKSRYYDSISFEFEIDTGIYNFSIPKLTLQPLVENAIYHGLKEKQDGGVLKVKGELKEDCILLIVMDDGVGMSLEQCNRLLLVKKDKKNHFGLRNADERIKLFFGEKYGIKINSELEVGTEVIVTIPKIALD